MSYITLECPFTQGNGMYRVEFDYTVSNSSSSYTVRLNRFSLYVNDYDSEDDDSRVSISVSLTSNGTSVFSGSQTHVEWWGTRWYPAGANAHKTFDKTEYSQNVSLQFTASAKGHTGNTHTSISIPAIADSYVTPSKKPTGLAIKREVNSFRASWKQPSGATSGPAAFTGQQVEWCIEKPGADITDDDYIGANETSNGQTYGEFKGNFNPWKNTSLTRRAFYPYTEQTVDKMTAWVRGYHKRANNGKCLYGPWTGAASFTFTLPDKPTVAWTYDTNSAKATVTVKSKSTDYDTMERIDTMIRVSIRKQDGKEATLMDWSATGQTEWKKTFDVSGYITNLDSGKFVILKCWAYARGIKGDNPAKKNAVYAERKVAMPSPSTITGITCDRKSSSGRIRVAVSVGANTGNVQLQRRRYKNNAWSGTWSDVSGARDDGNCKALYDSYGSVDPDLGEYVYYRIKSTADNFTVYGEAKRADCIYTAKPPLVCTATVGIIGVEPAKTGTSATVAMGYTDSTSNTGCEISWSDDPSAWNSTSGPSKATFTGDDTVRASTKYKKSRTVSVTGLTSGKTYYVRMRRYRTQDNETVYSGYSSTYSFATESAVDDSCGIASVASDTGGTSATLVIGIDEDNDNTGTEVTWSPDEDAWWSNQQPSLLNATWAPVTGDTDWPKKQTVYLRGLTPGTTYFVRARRYFSSGSATSYSPYSKTASFATPSASAAADVRCGLVSVTGGSDGKSAVVVVGWSGDRTATEVSWSKDPDAWESSAPPASTEFNWKDAASQSNDWAYTGTLYLRDLEEGATYYIAARTSYDGTEKVWSGYSAPMSVTPFAAPSEVVLSAPSAVARGESIECYWTVGSEQPQAEWHIHPYGNALVAIEEGTGSICHAIIPPERYGDATSLSFYVSAGCGGGLTSSNAVTVGIAEAPACECACSSSLTAQPAVFEAYTDTAGSRLLATLTSRGVTLNAPDGDADQLAGTTVWTEALAVAWTPATWADTLLREQLSDAVTAAETAYDDAVDAAEYQLSTDTEADPEKTYYELVDEAYVEVEPQEGDDPSSEGWYEMTAESELAIANALTAKTEAAAELAAHAADGECLMAQIELPQNLALIDNGSYDLSVQAVEPVAGLTSEVVECGFTVAWARQAPVPNGVTVSVDAENRSATIELAEPTGWASGDVHDVYRKTWTGYVLVARDLSATDNLVDPYAPFGDSSYRVAVRTKDGDVEFADFEYSLPVDALRFDWDGGSVELPYDLELSDSYSKDFEARSHVDGSVNGYYDKAVISKGSYKTNVLRFDSETLGALRKMGEHPGACFCRTADGGAFQCNADVDGLDAACTSAAVGASIAVTAMKLTADFEAHVEEEE